MLLQNKHSFKAAYTLLSLNENGILNDHVRQAIAIAHRNPKAVAESLRHLNKIGLLNSQNIQAVATHSKLRAMCNALRILDGTQILTQEDLELVLKQPTISDDRNFVVARRPYSTTTSSIPE